jgi:hypothetical protein
MASIHTGHLHQTARHGRTRYTRDAYVRRSRLSRPRGLHRRSVFAVIARDITDNVANDSNLRHVVHAMARTAPPSV